MFVGDYLEEVLLKKQIAKATKWSFITECIAKLINPLTNMILARILMPSDFGVIATITMITSFADMIADAGFQKYIIQNEFKHDEDRKKSTDVAFWTNLIIALFLWILIAVFSEKIAIMVGNKGLGNVILIACIQLPITAFSSIQIASCKRDFRYKDLFSVRVVSIIIPFITTIPLALLGFGYWSVIIGTIFGGISNALVLFFKCSYRPSFYYNFTLLKKMLSFSIWSLIEAISIWLTAWIDVFVIGTLLDQNFLGLYKNSINTVNSIMSIITVSTTSIIFSTLSRLQNSQDEFKKMFFLTQKLMAIIILPMGVGMYIYSDFITEILLGDQWIDASKIIGIWAITSAIKMVLGDYCSEVFRAKGRPKLSFLAQLLHLVVLVPICILSIKHSFITLVYSRSWIRMQLVFVQWIIMMYIIKIPMLKSFNNISTAVIGSALMGVLAMILRNFKYEYIWNFTSIGICIIFYTILTISIDSDIRNYFKEQLNKFNINILN
ncbi:polysaccharide biosynthesis protein [[Clostridium] sordellii]|nr:polysaccharide biosynthesis protein [[Clostridium] sordellii] [Paeniclostridium sordellii]